MEGSYKILINSESKKEWLRAIFDCEGYIGKKYIKLQSVSKYGIKDIQKLLKEFGISSKIYKYKPKNEKWNKVYMLFILKNQSIIDFLRKIGLNHEVKLNKLRQLAQVAEPGQRAQKA